MKPLRDIEGREDIQKLVDAFYQKVLEDPIISHFFVKVVQLDWEKHMPVMYDFWETTLLHTGSYKGNPMQTHLALHQKSPLKKEHFDRWVELFSSTVDALFSGATANLAKTRALSIATMMQIKIATKA